MANVFEQLRFLTDAAGVYVTSDRVIHARGDDARSWLNGQITNDVRELHGDHAVYALAATVKGRVVSDLWVLEEDGGMAIVLPAAGREAALDSFDKHLIMEDVELTEDATLRVLTVQGPKAHEVASAASAVSRRYDAHRLGAHLAGVDLWVPEAQLAATLDALEARARELGGGRVDDAGFGHAHVALGVPRFGTDFGPESYPQEAGLKSRAVSFSKGCYLGQEVIYMLENRGQLARRLVRLEGPEGASLTPGTTLEVDGKRMGEVTSVTVSSSGATWALGYLKRPVAEVGSQVHAAGVPYTVRSVVGVTDDECPIVAH